MKYRVLPHGGESISILGVGASSIQASTEKEIRETIAWAVENGINYFDLASAEAEPFEAYGQALEGIREKVYLQIHFGADYTSGSYGWTTDPKAIARSIDWQLKKLRTDYIDFGFIHCIDEAADLEKVKKNGVIDQILRLKEQGIVRHVGLSTHTPELANLVLDMGVLDMMMFSINPAYDYQRGDYGIGGVDERMELYRRCEREGVGISVMKAFGGGDLLDASLSPAGKALTACQCIHYALTRPGVASVLAGAHSVEQLKESAAYETASDEEKDYASTFATFPNISWEGHCMYCSHCAPCPKQIDVASVTKFLNLAKAQSTIPETVRDHYELLPHHAGECIECGSCETRCPFKVPIMENMKQAKEVFGK